jgi:hypothetical protein
MVTANLYVEQAKLLLLLAAADSDPVIKELLSRRAQEYLRMADALEMGSTAIEPQAAAPAIQQQQQLQPEKKEEE